MNTNTYTRIILTISIKVSNKFSDIRLLKSILNIEGFKRFKKVLTKESQEKMNVKCYFNHNDGYIDNRRFGQHAEVSKHNFLQSTVILMSIQIRFKTVYNTVQYYKL